MKRVNTHMFSAFLAAWVAVMANLTPAGALSQSPAGDPVIEKAENRSGTIGSRKQVDNCSRIGVVPDPAVSVAEKRAAAVLDSVPSSARSHLIADEFTDFPSRPALAIELITDNGEIRKPIMEAPGLAHAALPGVDVAISANKTAIQILGSTSETDRTISLAVKHALTCEGTTGLRIDVLPEGVAIDAIDEVGGRSAIAWVGKPWAVDAHGKELRTWFEANGDVLRQFVDTEGAVSPVTFDPTYFFMNCWNGHYSNLNAGQFLDIPANDPGWCPVMGMFQAKSGYRPVLGFESNVANDYGKIALRQGGGCSWSPDTGPSWDFQVPCKAHDYCYDLRRAGFSGTIPKSDCDTWFFWIMEAHCNNRVLADQCRGNRDTFYAAVLPFQADPDPAPIGISNFNSAQCLDVQGSSQIDGARVVQYWCSGTPNQRWKITPAAGHPGRFRLVATHSQKCADTWQTGITQWSCQYDEQIVDIRGAFNLNEYTIRPEVTSYTTCFDVPRSSRTPGEQIITYSCAETDNQLWFIS